MMHEIDILNMANGLAAHAGRRQAVIAENVAHADTPGYRAKDLVPFSETWDRSSFFPAHATRAGHAGFGSDLPAPAAERFVTALGASSPNGNTVSLEDQMVRAGETKLDHDMALSVWRSALGMLRSALGGASAR